jgi:ribosomal protein S12 methylthiotransferase
MPIKKYFFLNLGCPKNQVDGDYLRGSLSKSGLRETQMPEAADFIIVNTCAFIDQARLETKGEIEELSEQKKDGAIIIATGCYPVLHNIKNEIPQVDFAFAFDRQKELISFLSGGKEICWNPDLPARANPETVYGYVKISDGCDNRCSYCAIPSIRGAYRSFSPENIIREVQTLANFGVKEIILVAQDTTVYGKDLAGKTNLPDLCREIAGVEGVEWIRIMYAHPAHINEAMLSKLFSIDKVCRYLDLPIQHISDRILHSMNRRVNAATIKDLIKQLRNFDNDVSLRTTLMVGFPGESDDDFRQLVDFVEETRFDYIGAFCYSAENNTAANSMNDKVDPELARERHELLIDIAEQSSTQRARQMIGKRQQMLIEGLSSEDALMFEARSFRQAPGIDGYYQVPVAPGVKPGMLVEVLTTDISQGVL